MTKEPHWLLDFAYNRHSQCGEDGIIEKILSMLPTRNKHCVEFGAWDGKHLSNARRLIEEEGYGAVYIEGNPVKYLELEANYANNPKIITLNTYVGFDAQTGLDALLQPHSIPLNFDFLSIDIDGNDYYVWEAVTAFRPKLVVIEFNPTIPTEVDFVQERNPEVAQGCGLGPLCKLARGKGYELVCVQSYNAFFVDEKYFPLFEITDNRPSTLRRDLSLITWFFIGYDGSLHLSGSRMMHWHQIQLAEDEFQVLPEDLRTFPDNYDDTQKAGFKQLKLIRRGKQ